MPSTKERVLETVKTNRWNVQSFIGYAFFLSAAAQSGWKVGKALGADYTHFFYLLSKGRVSMYYDEEDWRRIGEAYYVSVKDVEALTALAERYEKEYREHSPAIPAHLETLPLPELLSLAAKVAEQLDYSVGFAHGIEGITFVSERKLRSILEAKGIATEMNLSKLSSPTYVSFLSTARRDLWRIHEAQPEEREALAGAFLKSFAWIENSYLGSARLTTKHVIARAMEVKSFQDFSEFEIARAEKESLMTEHGFSSEERFVVETIDLCFKWQDDRKRHILEAVEVMDSMLRTVAVATGIDFVDLAFALPSELIEEKLGSEAFRKELKARREGCAFYETPQGADFFTGADFKFFVESLHVDFGDGVVEVKGQPASAGSVTGIARVCESISDIARVQEGEILVASMTRPEYLLAMQKAAAFVTDEGGITCHAAIIAREMRKPCVIGTRIATKVIRDGDTIEVNANEGVVKILERAV